MIDRSKVWTGSLNELALADHPKRTAGFYDTTLRDGEQAVGVVFDPEQKLEIAKLVDGLGVGRIEAGFPRVSEDDKEAIRAIAQAGLNAEIWGFARAMIPDVEAVAELDLKYCVIEAPISDQKLSALGVSREKVLERIRNAVKFGTENGIHVAYFGVDSTRADLDFFETVYKTALEAGAKELAIVDTLAIACPEAVTYLVKRVKSWAGDVPVHFHGHNDFGLGTACAVAAINAGAEWIHGTIDGIGERAGNANIPEIALALELLYGIDTGIDLTRVRVASERLREIAGYELEPWKAVVGQNLFIRETGAVAAQFHLPHAIEPYSSELLDTSRGIRLGKKSGAASITIRANDLGLEVAEEKVPVLLEEVKKLAIAKRGLISDDEFAEIVERNA
ncbi:D-citramalate synthase [Breoghania corrubedonensis]|uniref:Homocitrate synthase n=1 Tax=Breoghania corrubedonensis TaxID=665038 RepID=A0A2T5VHF4_9HYPH|nr:homoaconitate hydratase [Breoghania corrubedonensis]PTW63190.1 D-citramalate synthase [Breoghania corrubedonensis]